MGIRGAALANQTSRGLRDPFRLNEARQQRRDDQRIGDGAADNAAPPGAAPEGIVACRNALHGIRPSIDASARQILVKRYLADSSD
jgi:hypothetical protein